MAVRVVETSLHQRTIRTRLPFRYGIATLTECPHLLCRVTLEVDGRPSVGVSADNLPPKWFTKDPNQSFADELEQMLAAIRSACGFAEQAGLAANVFELWKRVDDEQSRWGRQRNLPALLSAFGPSLVERAMIDAWCRATNITFATSLRDGSLGVRLEALHPELGALQPVDLLPAAPLRSIIARHTVGLLDPLTDIEIARGDRVADGLPQSLEAAIRVYGLTHFKLKLGGDVGRDFMRLQRIWDVLERSAVSVYAFTLDGNESYRDVASLRALWEAVVKAGVAFSSRLLFIEQPFHRDAAFSREVALGLCDWTNRPPIIIDESGATCFDVRRALDLGYAGASHKNCKGVFKGVANACLIAHRQRMNRHDRLILSGEDLTNIGPIALQQDLAVMASVGVTHVERNGHHYFAGLSMWPAEAQDATLSAHGDLYARTPNGIPAVRIERGTMQIGSVVDTSFGVGIPANFA